MPLSADLSLIVFVSFDPAVDIGRGPETLHSRGEPIQRLFACPRVDPLVIDLLLTDMVMKGMNGRQLADIVRGKYPDIRVIFMSGYTYDIVAGRGVIDEGMNFIQKPLRPTTLSKSIRDTLENFRQS